MGTNSGIDYVDASWGPWRGCTPVSEGCRNCYARRDMRRFGLDFETVTRASDKTFYAPMKWTEPKRIFVCPWGDFFHEAADVVRRDALEVIEACPQHTFVIPTKRTERMVECLYGETGRHYLGGGDYIPNMWILASVEDQATADVRIPELLKLGKHGAWPVLGVSYEPALGPVDFNHLHYERLCEIDALNGTHGVIRPHQGQQRKLDWLVMGGESGPNARPMHPDWVRQTRDACVAAGVPFFYKQWGEYGTDPYKIVYNNHVIWIVPDGRYEMAGGGDLWDENKAAVMGRVGKKAAGHIIDGREWRQFPEVGA